MINWYRTLNGKINEHIDRMNRYHKRWVRAYLACLLLIVFFAEAGRTQGIGGGMHPRPQIDFVKNQIRLRNEPYLSAYQTLLKKADSALALESHALEDFSIPGYYQDKIGHQKNSLAFQLDGISAYSCALAYRLGGEKKYAKKALFFLNAWAKVNKKYSQLDGSLVMSYSGTTFMIAADLLKADKAWKPADQELFRTWTRNVFRHAANSIRYRNNNSGDWSRFASLLADVYLNDQEDFQQNVALIKKDLFDKIAPDGHMVEEVKRQAKGIWYTYFSLAPLTASSWVIYTQTAEDLFKVERNGASIKKALDYLLYYNQHPMEWKYAKNPETNLIYTETGPWPANLLEAMNGIYHSAEYDRFVSTYRPVMYPKHDYAWTFPTLMPLSLTGFKQVQKQAAAKPPKLQSDGFKLVWAEEFNYKGAPDPKKWIFEKGFERNEELQWYQEDNAWCENGNLILEARKESKVNPNYVDGSNDWKRNRKEAEYTSASIKTRGLHTWLYGRFVMRGKIDIRDGIWPAWWTLGIRGKWPATGEIDIMEYYRKRLLANIAYMGSDGKDAWFSTEKDIEEMGGTEWAKQYHVWRMDWDEQGIALYVDDHLLNKVEMSKLVNQDGTHINPFQQPHYMLLDLAIGGKQGGSPANTSFPARFEVDYIRVYQK